MKRALPKIEVDCLGGLRLSLGTQPLSLTSAKAQVLICYLAISGRPHSREELSGLLWSELPEAAARANLRTMLPKLRKALGTHLKVSRDTVALSGYRLDVELFLSKLSHLEGEPDITQLQEAVKLYRGDLLEGVQIEGAPLFDEWLAGQRERFKQLAVGALHALATHHIARQEYTAATDMLSRLLGLEPWREDGHRQLMTMLAVSGQRDAALQQYQRCCQVLDESLGIEPSAETRELYDRILAGQLAACAPAPQSSLPRPLTPVLGRGTELGQLAELLIASDSRLITLHGPGGVGKTRLALAAAAEHLNSFEDGVHFINLAVITNSERVVAAISEVLGVDEGIKTLQAYLHDKHLLLVLDNFEQVIAAAPLVSELLTRCPKIRVLVTSRRVLDVRGERRFAVSPLAVPNLAQFPVTQDLMRYPAVALFCERAQQAKPGFGLTESNAPTIATICVRLDGLPLALELAAARIRALSPQQILERLSDRMKLLSGGSRDLEPRQRTLHNAIAWSYDLLGQEARCLFEQLGVFVGGITLEAAGAVCGNTDTLDILEGITALLDASLLHASEDRFEMLESIREFALTTLTERGGLALARQRHTGYYLALVEHARLTGKEQAVWIERLTVEQDNLRAALRWTLQEGAVNPGLRLAGGLWRYWHMRGHLSEGRMWTEALLGLPGESVSAARADTLNGAGVFAWMQADYECARARLLECLTIRQTLGDTVGIAVTLNNLGVVAYLQEAYAEAQQLYEETLALYREQSDPLRMASTLGNLGIVLYMQDDLERARAINEEVLTCFRSLEDDWSIATTLNNLARVLKRQGDTAQAAALINEGLVLGRQVGAARTLVDLVEKAAGLLVNQMPEVAARLWGAAEAYRERLGAPMEVTSKRGYREDLQRAEKRLNPADFAAAWAKGRRMDFDEAVSLALVATTPGESVLYSRSQSQ
jgi:predicted ATPase/DNA-binding SARP family transcriptional activator